MKRTKVPKILMVSLLFILQAAVLCLAGGEKESAAPTTTAVSVVKIGNLLPLSGGLANDGAQQKRGFDLAVEEINAAGGIKSLGGAKMELIYADSRGEPQVGMSEVEKLITVEKVSLVTGAFQSSVTLPTTSVAEKYRIPYYVPNATSDAITEQGFKYTFRSSPKAGFGTRDIVNFLLEMGTELNDEVKNMAIIYEDTEGGQTFAAGMRHWAEEKNLPIIFEEAYPHGTSDVSPMIAKLKAAKPDALVANSYVQDAILIGATIVELQFRPKVMVGWGGYGDPAFLKSGSQQGWCIAGVWTKGLNNRWTDKFTKDFESKYDITASMHAAIGYHGAYVIKEALELSGSTDSEKLAEAFRTLRITDQDHKALILPYGEIYFDEKGQCPTARYIMGQYQGDTSTTVWPVEVAPKGTEIIWPIPAR